MGGGTQPTSSQRDDDWPGSSVPLLGLEEETSSPSTSTAADAPATEASKSRLPPRPPPSASHPPGAPLQAMTRSSGANVSTGGEQMLIPIYPEPIIGMAVRPPRVPPQPGHVLVGYEVCQPRAGCCQFEGLSFGGIATVILLLLFFWPLAWVPCLMPQCFNSFLRPVYGFPRTPPPGYVMMVTPGFPAPAVF
ncbi:hypothetical protein D9Q98_008127 [Chlorella vulgaris]|uniref:Uncharacterized protein n=1 Tax=Chlorella vulgaris TaxID=3077 RepID=A0A9D4TG43_CHLVU|nr:hypothetical protein D9Q98_008127 [Chlorella vulgaris]